MRDFLEKIGLIFVQPTSTVHTYSNPLARHIMRTQHLANHRFSHQALSTKSQCITPPASTNNGLITEFVYSESQPFHSYFYRYCNISDFNRVGCYGLRHNKNSAAIGYPNQAFLLEKLYR